MARKPRLEWENAAYHIMARGNDRARIFYDEQDYLLFVETLQESVSRFGIELHAWVLMPNHYHLAASTPRANLSRGMAWLQTTFTSRYNRNHRRSGHLFQGRYRAELVDADAYARQLVLYIHLNPIRSRKGGSLKFTGGLKELEAFPWSGHKELSATRKKALIALSPDWSHYWAKGQIAVRKGYGQAIRQSLGSEPEDWKELLQGGLVAGGPELLEQALRLLTGQKDHESVQWRQSQEWGQRKQRVEALLRKEPDRAVASWVKVTLLGQRGVEVAAELGYKDGSGVTRAVRRMERDRAENKILNAKLNEYVAHARIKG